MAQLKSLTEGCNVFVSILFLYVRCNSMMTGFHIICLILTAFGKTRTGFTLHHLQVVHPVWLIGSDYYHLSTPVEPIHLGPPGGQ